MKTKRIVIIGAGGFAREARWLLQEVAAAGSPYRFVGYVVSDLSRLSERDSRAEVLGDLGWLDAHREDFEGLVLGIGSPAPRERLSAELLPRFPPEYWPALVHPTVRMDRDSCRVEHGALVCAGTIATVNVRFGAFSLVNLACTVGHESRIGVASVLSPTVNVSGGVELGDGVLVGTGAQLLQYLRVGDHASVGAGAVVTKDVPPGETVVGIPARPLARRT